MSYRRKNQRLAASHAEDWLMTYADMITLLLCFFVVLLIVTISKQQHDRQTPTVQTEATAISPVPVKPPVTQVTPQLPSVFHDNLPFHQIAPVDIAENDQPAAAPSEEPVEPAMPQPNVATPPAVNEPVAQIQQLPPTPPISVPVPAETPMPSPVLPAAAPKPGEQTQPGFERKSDRITTFNMSSAAFFDSGSATLNSSGGAILQNVAEQLNADEFKDYQITVEGHTDDTPIHTALFPSNWELSTARASAVLHFLLDHGVPATKLRAAGYADTFPLFPNRDSNGDPIPDNQARNRRVVITLEKIDKAQ